MKKVLSLALLVVILGCTSTQAITNQVEKGFISVSTSANAEIAPDTAEISIAIQTFDNKSMNGSTVKESISARYAQTSKI